MLIKMAMTIYVFLNFKKLILKEDDTITMGFESLDLDSQDPVEYEDTEFSIFWSITKTRRGYDPFNLDDIDIDTGHKISNLIKVEFL